MTEKKKRVNYVRTIRKAEMPSKSLIMQTQEFPKDDPGVIYVRQSTIAQVQKNLHSFEMQTNEFVKYFRETLGVTSHIEIIADDEGKSGTLDIHNRAGLTRVVQLIEGKELLEGRRIKWVGAVHVNRLTRDEWLIVPGVLMRECYENDVWIATLRMLFNFNDEYCKRVFMLEAEEAARNLKWMKEIMHGGLVVASNKGLHDGRPVLPGYIVDHREYIEGDKKNPTYKKYIVYEPHALVVRWLFQRYLELDGNLPVLLSEVEASPYLFPPFEEWVSRRNVLRFSGHRSMLKQGPFAGHYKPSSTGIATILTNPVYLGWWIPLGGGLIENNHQPIIDSALFFYAHRRLSPYDLEGKRQKPIALARNGKAEALLKKVAQGPVPRSWIYSRIEINHKKNRKIVYACYRFNGLKSYPMFAIEQSKIDGNFLTKFFERLHEWEASGALNDWVEKREALQVAQVDRKEQIQKAIKEAEARMRRINDIITDIDAPPSKAQELSLKQMYADLAIKVENLKQERLSSLDEEDEDEEQILTLHRIWTLIPQLKKQWESLSFDERLAIVGAFTRKVVFSIPSPGWIKMEVEWKIGMRDVMHLQRPSNGSRWTEGENTLLREIYSTVDGAEILRQFPTRTWKAIKAHALRELKLPGRASGKLGEVRLDRYHSLSLQDVEYAEENGLATDDKNPQWQMARSNEPCQ